jgi:N-acetylglutamate synthase-like GNAT family acetyltransferase
MIHSITVREAKAADAPALQLLYQELVPEAPVDVREDSIDQLAASATSFLLVAEANTEILGTLLLTICPDVMFADQPFAVFENIVVRTSWRRRGIGRHLLAEAQCISMNLACSKILLMSSKFRTEAHGFFHAQGFAGDEKRGFVKFRSRCVFESEANTLLAARHF